MKTIITLFVSLLLLVTIGLQAVSQGVKGGGSGENSHMNRVCCILAGADSGSDGVGGPSFDRGYKSRFY